VNHDDAQREYAYKSCARLPDTKVGTFTQALYDEAESKGWIVVVSMRITGTAFWRSMPPAVPPTAVQYRRFGTE
jgi:hypothetical protein